MMDDIPTDRIEPPTGAHGSSPRPGRPLGSVSLTPEIQQIIVTYIRAGAFGHAAAEAAGVPARTFYDWMARGEGRHPTRRPTRKLRAFAQAVRRAQAEARVGAEVRVYKERPTYWLTHAARTKPDREGWTKPPAVAGQDPGLEPSLEDRLAELDRQRQLEQGCTDPQCRCGLHERSSRYGKPDSD
jgi:hypothetical protein